MGPVIGPIFSGLIKIHESKVLRSIPVKKMILVVTLVVPTLRSPHRQAILQNLPRRFRCRMAA